jgi:hypothetical protein
VSRVDAAQTRSLTTSQAEALALLRKSIYHTAPNTHGTVPRLKTWDAIRAAFDPHDDPNAPPKQSASEQQVRPAPAAPMHGLRIWDKIVTYVAKRLIASDFDRFAGTWAGRVAQRPRTASRTLPLLFAVDLAQMVKFLKMTLLSYNTTLVCVLIPQLCLLWGSLD